MTFDPTPPTRQGRVGRQRVERKSSPNTGLEGEGGGRGEERRDWGRVSTCTLYVIERERKVHIAIILCIAVHIHDCTCKCMCI